MRNISLTLEYDGTGFSGWQMQPGTRTVQSELAHAVSGLLGQAVAVTGASRTDAGVHAYGQRANFKADFPIPTDRLKKAINGFLPGDIRVTAAEEVDDSFHSRFSAKGKTYVYKVLNQSEPVVFFRNQMLHVPAVLDIDAMSRAALYFEGTHDFKAFSASNGELSGTAVRTIQRFRVTKDENDIILLKVTGNAFLYKMVRMMAGALIDIGLRNNQPEAVLEALSGTKARIGRTAQPQGLYLLKVYYDESEILGELG